MSVSLQAVVVIFCTNC